MAKFDGVIFDWAGTTVDYGCLHQCRPLLIPLQNLV